MPEDPIDFDDWLKGLELGGTSNEIQVIESAAPIEDAALASGLEVTTEGSPEMDFDPLPETSGPASPTLEAELLNNQRTEASQIIEAAADEIEEAAAIIAGSDDLRTVGDRVTLVFNAVSVVNQRQSALYSLLANMASELLILRAQMNALLEEVEVKQAVQPITMPEPLPLDDILPPSNGTAPAPAEVIRRRRRKAT